MNMNTAKTNKTSGQNQTAPRKPSNKLFLLLTLFVLAASNAFATILAYEPFNYTAGAFNAPASTATGTPTATTGGGFSGWFSGAAGASIVTGLTYPGLQAANNALQWATSINYEGENLTTPITPATYGTVYVSFLYNAPSYTANKTGLAVDAAHSNNTGYYMGMTASGTFGVATVDNGSGTVLGTASGTISFNTTYFIVVKFVKDSGGTYYQSGSIYINPTPGGSEPAASGTFTGTYTSADRIGDFLTLGSSVITDEIRIGTTWADVTPPSGITPPATPTGLGATPGVNSVALSWTASTGSPVSYNVKRSTTSGGTYVTIGTTTAPTVTYTDTVTGGTTYYYEVSAVNVGGESANTAYVSALPTLGVPSAPTGLSATPGINQVSLNWTASAAGTPTSYNVKRSTTSGSGYSTIGTTTAPTVAYTDSNATNGTTYYYVVSAVNGAGEGAISSQASATPSPFANVYESFSYSSIANGTAVTGIGESGTWTCGTAPSIVTGLTYSGLPTANSAMQSSGSRQAVGFTSSLSSGTKWISFLFQSGSGNSGANINGVYFSNGGTGLWFGFGLAPSSSTQGALGIGSMNTTGTSALGASDLAHSYLGTYGSVYFVAIKIDFNTSGANDTVTVYINPTANSATPVVAATYTVSSFDVGTITGMGLNVQGAGSITVDEIRTGSYYSDVSGYVSVVSPPGVPTGLGATAGVNSVDLSWTASTNSPFTYNVKRSTTSGGTYVTVGTTTDPTVTYTDNVTGGSTYYYKVSAVNSTGGESANSSYVSATPTIGAPSAPTDLAATLGDSQVALTWTAPAVGSPTSYNVLRSTTSGSGYSTIGTTTAPTVAYTDATAVNGTPYFYVVQAVNAGGTSGNSSEVTATPAAYMAPYESFNYGALADGTATTASGFTGNWTNTGTATLVTGLTYPGLPTANSAFEQTGGRASESLTYSLSSGTAYVSFLFNQLGDNGGDLNGVYFPGSGANSLFCGFGVLGADTATTGSFGLGSVPTSGGAAGATPFVRATGITYSHTHLAVLKIDFNTSGANDTVSLWIDPPAGTNDPGRIADMTYSSFNVGTISGVGFNLQGGANADEFDEVRIGSTYGSVVAAASGVVPTTLALSVASGKEISWSANSADFYQPQSSPDGSTWSNLGGQLTGSAVTSVYDPASATYYQVLQDTPVIAEEVQNEGFEFADGGTGAAGWLGVGATPPTRITTDFHTGAACESLYVTNATIAAQVAGIEQNVVNNGGAAIVPGKTYTFSFWAKSLGHNPSGGYVQQYNPQWVDGTGAIVGPVVWTPFTANTSTWTQISSGPMVAPAGAVSVLIQIETATGGIQDDFGGVLVDDVSLATTSPSGSPTVIAATVQSGAVFTATVQTNGVTASTATGTVAFKTNSVAQSTGTVSTGVANSTPTAVPAAYTITAIYSGDSFYAGSTNTLVVGSGVNPSRTNIVMNVSGNQLTLTWPADHTGWTLQSQTNGLTGTWYDVAGSTTTHQMILTINPTNPAVFYRMKY